MSNPLFIQEKQVKFGAWKGKDPDTYAYTKYVTIPTNDKYSSINEDDWTTNRDASLRYTHMSDRDAYNDRCIGIGFYENESNNSRKAMWNLMNDGTLISAIPPVIGDNTDGNLTEAWLKERVVNESGNSYPFTVSYEGRQYTLECLQDGNNTAGKSSDYLTYIGNSEMQYFYSGQYKHNVWYCGKEIQTGGVACIAPDGKPNLYKGYAAVGIESEESNYRSSWQLRFKLVPAGDAAVITIDNRDLGVVTKCPVITLNLSNAANVTVFADDVEKGTFAAIAGDNQWSADSFDIWDSMADSEETNITFQAISDDGYKTYERVSFTKKYSEIKISGNTVSLEKRPASCTVVSATSTPTGSTVSFEVTNNGNDETPTWETYSGDTHVFENTTKTAEKWGLNWKMHIDAGNATTANNAEAYNQIALGVLFDEGN